MFHFFSSETLPFPHTALSTEPSSPPSPFPHSNGSIVLSSLPPAHPPPWSFHSWKLVVIYPVHFFSHLPSHPCYCLYSWKQLAPKLAFLLWALLMGHMNVTCSLLLVEELCFVLADHKSSCDVWRVNLSPRAEHFTLTHIFFHILSPVGQILTVNIWSIGRHQRVPSCVSKVRNEDFKKLWER